MDHEAAEAANHGARENAPLPSPEQPRQAQGREGHQIVQQHGLPAPGVSPVKNELEQSEREACQQAGLEAPADGEKDNGEHGGRQRPAVGQLQQLDVAEDLGAGHHHGRLCQAADGDDGIGRTFITFLVGVSFFGHENFLLLTAGSACGGA